MDAHMNMPDPQAMANAWMTQFSDPASWSSWFSMPQADANPLSAILKDAGAGINPATLETIKADYMAKASALFQDFMNAKIPELKDRRFAAPEWQANPVSA